MFPVFVLFKQFLEQKQQGKNTEKNEKNRFFSQKNTNFLLKLRGFRGNVLNVQAAVTYRFLAAVLTEVLELFPGRFVHVGMDEIPPKAWTHDPQEKERNWCFWRTEEMCFIIDFLRFLVFFLRSIFFRNMCVTSLIFRLFWYVRHQWIQDSEMCEICDNESLDAADCVHSETFCNDPVLHLCCFPKAKKKEQLRALLASWLQDFLQARGRSMLAWEEAFSGDVFRCTPDEDKAVSPKPCPAVGRKQRGCSTCRATASSYGMERWWALCSPRSQWWFGCDFVPCPFSVFGYRPGFQLWRQVPLSSAGLVSNFGLEVEILGRCKHLDRLCRPFHNNTTRLFIYSEGSLLGSSCIATPPCLWLWTCRAFKTNGSGRCGHAAAPWNPSQSLDWNSGLRRTCPGIGLTLFDVT